MAFLYYLLILVVVVVVVVVGGRYGHSLSGCLVPLLSSRKLPSGMAIASAPKASKPPITLDCLPVEALDRTKLVSEAYLNALSASASCFAFSLPFFISVIITPIIASANEGILVFFSFFFSSLFQCLLYDIALFQLVAFYSHLLQNCYASGFLSQ